MALDPLGAHFMYLKAQGFSLAKNFGKTTFHHPILSFSFSNW